jgi:hypothetical protein
MGGGLTRTEEARGREVRSSGQVERDRKRYPDIGDSKC